MEMTVKQAFDSICEDGIALGAGDYVDPEALEVAAIIMAKVLRGKLVEVVRCKYCRHFEKLFKGDGVINKIGTCYLRKAEGIETAQSCEDFCSYGEKMDGGNEDG